MNETSSNSSTTPSTASSSSENGFKRRLEETEEHAPSSDVSLEPAAKKRKKIHKVTILYKPNDASLFEIYKPGKALRVFIPAKDLFSEAAHAIKKVWGTDVYTEASDLIGVCQHSGKLKMEELEAHRHQIRGVLVGVKICEPQKRYVSTFRNNIRSKSWINEVDTSSHNAYSIESFKVVFEKYFPSVTSGVQKSSTEKYVSVIQRAQSALAKIKGSAGASEEGQKLDSIANELEQYRFLPNVTLVWNLSNEPCIRYSMNTIADQGYDPKNTTSMRLKGEVIYMESKSHRYELCWLPETNRFRFAVVKNPHTMSLCKPASNISIPLDASSIEVLHDDLLWGDLKWGPDSVSVSKPRKGSSTGDLYTYPILNIQFCKRTSGGAPATTVAATPSSNDQMQVTS